MCFVVLFLIACFNIFVFNDLMGWTNFGAVSMRKSLIILQMPNCFCLLRFHVLTAESKWMNFDPEISWSVETILCYFF